MSEKPTKNGSYTPSQIAHVCGVSPVTVGKWIDGGLLKGFHLPGSGYRRVLRDDLLRFLKENDLPSEGLV